MSATPPLIPGSLNLSTLEVNKIKIVEEVLGDALSSLNTWKGSVVAATTANITLSGTQTVDGVALVVGDRVLVKDQSTGSENGIYKVDEGAWTRTQDLVAGSNAAGIAVFVNEGTASADQIFVCTNDEASAVVGTDALTFSSLTATIAAAGADTQVQFNSSGSLAADAGFTYDGAGTATLSVGLDATSLTLGNGANESVGTATLVAGTVTVANTSIAASDLVFVTLATPGGTLGAHYRVGTITASTSFVLEAVDTAGAVVATDTSTINYMIVRV